MAPRQRKKAKKEDSMTKATLSVVMCPITMNLVVDPVVAADGHTYEREAIERWLRDKGRSPMTNQSIGTTVVELRGGREMVLGAIEAGAVDDREAATWRITSARRIAAGALPGGSAGAREHLQLAEDQVPSRESATLLEAAGLREELDGLLKRVDAFASEASGKGVQDAEAFILGGRGGALGAAARAAPAAGVVMAEWRHLAPNSALVRIIDDDEELEQLCEREAPDAADAVGWDDDMVDLCGKVYVVGMCNSVNKSYSVRKGPGSTYWVPFDACILLADRIDGVPADFAPNG